MQFLKFPKMTCGEAGTYSVRASNMAGEAKCFCHVVVNPTLYAKEEIAKEIVVSISANAKPPEFKKLLTDQTSRVGKPFKYLCVISGEPKVGTKCYLFCVYMKCIY